MELLDELRESEKKKQSSPQPPIQKKQIHFSDSGDYEKYDTVIRDREKTSSTSSAFRSVKHEVNVLPNRRHRKSIANSDISSSSTSSIASANKLTILLARYFQLKHHLE